MALRIAFFGTPAFAVPSLEALADAGFSVVAAVTQPDKPRGRGHRLLPSEVKTAALARGMNVLQPARLNVPEFLETFRELRTDFGVVAAYGRILPKALLDLPRLGMVNVHASLLPRWRGAAPVHRAILAGDEVTGVTIMRVVQKLDAGPILAMESTPISIDETSEALEHRLARLGAGLLIKTLQAMERGPVPEKQQDEALVTYASKLEKQESGVDWGRPALAIHNQIRGLQPWPLASTRLRGNRTLLRSSQYLPDEAHHASPGTIVRAAPDGLVVACNPGAVQITELQLEGKHAMSVAAFLNGHRVAPGDRFES